MADSTRDFAPAARSMTSPPSPDLARQQSSGGHLMPSRSPTARRDHSPLSVDPSRPPTSATGYFSPNSAVSVRSPFGRRSSVGSADSFQVRNRPRRSSTVRTYDAPSRPNWEPGAEPGIDTSAQDNVDESFPRPQAACDITVVDFSEEQVEETELNNLTLPGFLSQPRADWVDCRWICVNGMDWGVIKLLGSHKKLHPLAIEDLMSTRSRPKVDWYSDHAFIVMSLQKLVRIFEDKEHESDSSDDDLSVPAHGGTDESISAWRRVFLPKKFGGRHGGAAHDHDETGTKDPEKDLDVPSDELATTHAQEAAKPVRTLQRWRGGPNVERIEYIESKSALTKRNLAVSVEQVCIFLTDDNTVITFFEHSSEDVLQPISSRLNSDNTILRRSADASLLVQAIIDAIIDLAMPVAAAYDDAFGSLELEVLTDPDMEQPQELYILTSEINLLRSVLEPFTNLIHSLREHKQDSIPTSSVGGRPPIQRLVTSSSVMITPLTHTYLGDVEDHIIMLSANLDRMRQSAEKLTSLIFNTMSAHQNESMKQLTLVTIFFLPLTFLAGYFGMNFDHFSSIHKYSDAFFWYCAIPVIFVTCLFMMRNWLVRETQTLLNKWWIRQNKKRRILQERTRIATQRARVRAMTMPRISEEPEGGAATASQHKEGKRED